VGEQIQRLEAWQRWVVVEVTGVVIAYRLTFSINKERERLFHSTQRGRGRSSSTYVVSLRVFFNFFLFLLGGGFLCFFLQ